MRKTAFCRCENKGVDQLVMRKTAFCRCENKGVDQLVMRKTAFCICEKTGVDQLDGDHIADQHLSFCHIDGTIPLLPKSEVSSL